MIFDNWNISGCVKLRMLDNKTSSFDVVGNIPDGWEWQLLYSCNGNLNIVEMQHEENILSVIFTKEMLPTDGTYLFQLKATKDDLVKHTNIVKSYVNKSLSGDIKWPVIPTEFTQIEQVVKGYAESAKESSIKAENAAVHSPIVGENGNWFVWDFEKSEYVDSGKPASIGGGTDPSLGITAATVGQTVKVKAVDTEGKPTAWEPVDVASMSNDWMLLADITLAEDSAVIKIDKTPSGGSFSIRELAFFGGVKCDTVNKTLTLSANGKIGYGNPSFNLGQVLNAAESNTEYLAAYVNVLPECLFSRVQHNEYNPLYMNRNTPSFSASALRNEAQIANQSLGDPITVFAIAPWSDGKSGVFKAGTSLKFYGRE